MEHLTWEFDGRCPRCGSEELYTEVVKDDEVMECLECKHKFMVLVDLNEAILY